MNLLLVFVLGTTFNAQVVAGQPTYDFKEGGAAKASIETGGLYCPGSSAAGSLPGTCKNGSVVQDSTNGQLRVCQGNVWRPLVMPLACTSGQALTSTSTTAYACTSTITASAYSGTLPVANGGTNSTATPTSGGVGYGTGSAHAYTSAGTAGQKLQSNGSSAPTWVNSPTVYYLGAGVSTSSTSTPASVLSFTIPTRMVYFNCTVGVLGTATAAPRFAWTIPGTTVAMRWTKFPTSISSPTYEYLRTTSGTYSAACTSSCYGGYSVWSVDGYTWNTGGTMTLNLLSSTSGQTVYADGAICYVY